MRKFCPVFVSSFAATMTISGILSVCFSTPQPHQGIGVLTCRKIVV